MLAAILGFLAALPDLIKGVLALASWVDKKVKEDPDFFKDMGVVFENLNKAQSAEEHMQSASDISKLIRRV